MEEASAGHFPEYAAGQGWVDEGGLATLRSGVRFAGFCLESEVGEFGHRLLGVVDFPAQVMHAFTALFDELCDGMCVMKWLDELELHITHIEMSQPNTNIFKHFTENQGESQSSLVEPEGFFSVLYGDGDVIELLKHIPRC
jgi:hypothetical protein